MINTEQYYYSACLTLLLLLASLFLDKQWAQHLLTQVCLGCPASSVRLMEGMHVPDQVHLLCLLQGIIQGLHSSLQGQRACDLAGI